jgi:hypothetical protein
MTPLMLLSHYLFQPLTEALPTRGGGFLNTIQDALNYLGDLPPHRALRPHWRFVGYPRKSCSGGSDQQGQVRPRVG